MNPAAPPPVSVRRGRGLRRAALGLGLLPAVLTAQQPATGDSLTLARAIGLAQQRSHAATAARATLEAARYRGRAFSAGLLPQLALTGNVPQYNSSIIPVLQPDGTTLFRTQQQTNTTMALRLSQRLPVTGGDLFVTSSLARLALSGSQATETWSSTPFSVGLRQDILRPNATRWDRREQNVRVERDERAYREAMEDLALQTVNLFFAAYAARVALVNAQSNAAVNDTLYRLNQGRYDVGRIGENDLLQSQLALLRSRASLEGAQLEFERAMAALRIGIGMPPGTALAVAVTTDIPEIAADTAEAVAQAMRNRAAVTDVELAGVQAGRRIAEARLANGVGATVQASYGYNATAPDAGLAYQNLLEAKLFSVSVSVPLWQFGAHANTVRAARADADRVESQSQTTLEQLAMDARFAALGLGQARRNLALAVTADSVAGRRFEVAYNRYVIGRIGVDNLYLAQSEKDQALTQYVDGLRRYWEAYYRLRRVTLYDFVERRPIR